MDKKKKNLIKIQREKSVKSDHKNGTNSIGQNQNKSLTTDGWAKSKTVFFFSVIVLKKKKNSTWYENFYYVKV